MKKVSSWKSFGGEQHVFEHDSEACDCAMRFAVYAPPPETATGAALIWLSGLTCTEENFIAKAGAQRVASTLGLHVVAPDTSPRGEGVPDDPDGAYDFGLGAGFYVDAMQTPWSTNYRMRTYIEEELLRLLAGVQAIDTERLGIAGHSMGGHGALTMALRRPELFKSVSAFAPIASPMNCPWGEKALGGYLGTDRGAWREYDACALIEDGARTADILVDQGEADNFLQDQLKPDLLEAACAAAGQPLTLRRQAGYDHSYYFIASFIEDHLRWHADRLG